MSSSRSPRVVSVLLLFVRWSVVLATLVTLVPAPAHATRASHDTLVVLVPGFGGNKPGAWVYFAELEEALARAGFDSVTLAPPPVATSEARGRALAAMLAEHERAHPHARVVAIGHSQGGVDVRAALVAGAPFAAVATLSTPHHGTDVAEVARSWPRALVVAGLDVMSRFEQWINGDDVTDPAALDALKNLTRKGMRTFNAAHPPPALPFFSVAALSGAAVDDACSGGAWRKPYVVDTLHPALVVGRAMIRSRRAVSDDGVVPTRSMRYGRFLGCVPADHMDWQRWDVELEAPAFDAVAFVVELARGLDDAAQRGAPAMDAHVPTLAKLAKARRALP